MEIKVLRWPRWPANDPKYTAQIYQRTLTSVGGTRPGARHTKKGNKRARRMGFVDMKEMVDAMMKRANGNMSTFRRLMAGAA